jgi:hypothetical protein
MNGKGPECQNKLKLCDHQNQLKYAHYDTLTTIQN